MLLAAIIIAVILITSTLAVVLWTSVFASVFFRQRPARIADEDCPRAAVLMGLKGTDPFLFAGLKRLLTQDYPNYEVHFVVDSRDDPAWELVEQVMRETAATHATIQEFQDLPENGIVNCTNSKVVQALRGLPEGSCEIIAMADGDVVAGDQWLRDLVTPLVLDEKVGVTSGNRWFIPPRARLGTLVRSLWNMAATSIMYHMNMPWGGCYAIRMSVIREGGLIEKWARVGALDMFTTREMKQLGKKIEFVPTLMMVNREDCGLPFSFNFIRRQLTWAQLYNPSWPLVVLLAVLGAGLVAGATALGMWGLISDQLEIAAWSFGGLAVYSLGISKMAMIHDWCVRRMLKRSGQEPPAISLQCILAYPVALPLTVFVHFLAVMHCLFFKRISWRGAMLEFNGPHEIRVVHEVEPQVSAKSATAAGAESL